MTAIVILALNPDLRTQPAIIASAIAVVVSSWILVVTAYAGQYAREQAERPAFVFEGDDPLIIGDRSHVAVQVSTRFSTRMSWPRATGRGASSRAGA